jgi:hypothetical protein
MKSSEVLEISGLLNGKFCEGKVQSTDASNNPFGDLPAQFP